MKKRPTLRTNLSIVLSFIICFPVLEGLSNIVQAETFIEKAGYEEVAAAAREAVAQQMSTWQSSSATVAVMVDGEVVYAEGFGLRDRARDLPVDIDTQFNNRFYQQNLHCCKHFDLGTARQG
jgi:CubicO group peptidase (beta-lactamase class C family)